MGELDEAQWAVISERGVEANDLTHRQSLELMQRLTQEKVNGLSIVTSAAARRFTQTPPAHSGQQPRSVRFKY